MQFGPVRFRVDAKIHAARRAFDHRLIVRETGLRMSGETANVGIQEFYRALASDGARNTCILDDVIAAIHEGRSPILLTERKDYIEYFRRRPGRIGNRVDRDRAELTGHSFSASPLTSETRCPSSRMYRSKQETMRSSEAEPCVATLA